MRNNLKTQTKFFKVNDKFIVHSNKNRLENTRIYFYLLNEKQINVVIKSDWTRLTSHSMNENLAYLCGILRHSSWFALLVHDSKSWKCKFCILKRRASTFLILSPWKTDVIWFSSQTVNSKNLLGKTGLKFYGQCHFSHIQLYSFLTILHKSCRIWWCFKPNLNYSIFVWTSQVHRIVQAKNFDVWPS